LQQQLKEIQEQLWKGRELWANENWYTKCSQEKSTIF
jgi:hypothetical protein